MSVKEHSRIPSLKGIAAAIGAIQCKIPESSSTDMLGISGLCMVFPEFYPIRNKLQYFLTLGHHVDHINDEGPHARLRPNRPFIIESFSDLYTHLITEHIGKNETPLLANAISFLSQGAVIEKEAHSWQNPSQEQVQRYRELINAVWTRMMISYGFGILSGELDSIGNSENAGLSYHELVALYEPYMQGKQNELVPGKERNLALYKWTMAIQKEYDQFGLRHRTDTGLPILREPIENYTLDAIHAGVLPQMIDVSLLMIRGILNLKRIMNGYNVVYPREVKSSQATA